MERGGSYLRRKTIKPKKLNEQPTPPSHLIKEDRRQRPSLKNVRLMNRISVIKIMFGVVGMSQGPESILSFFALI